MARVISKGDLSHSARPAETISVARLDVRVTPQAARDEVRAVSEELVEVRLRAPAVEGQANAALIRFLAAGLGLRPGAVTLVRGATSRRKVVAVAGLDSAEARRRLTARIGRSPGGWRA